jgi:hypothetical protein
LRRTIGFACLGLVFGLFLWATLRRTPEIPSLPPTIVVVALVDSDVDAVADETPAMEDVARVLAFEPLGPYPDLSMFCGDEAGACWSEEHMLADARFDNVRVIEDAPCSARHLAVRTSRGWFRLRFDLSPIVCGDPDEVFEDEVKPRVLGDHLVIRVRHVRSTWTTFDSYHLPTGDPIASYSEESIVCDRTLDCTSSETAVAPSKKNGTIDDAVWRPVRKLSIVDGGAVFERL